MPRPKLTLFLDIVSPFSYMAFHATQHLRLFQQCDITYIPIFLGGVMKACDNRPPTTIKNKGAYITLEKTRWARAFEIPFGERMPEPFPQSTLHVQRALCAVHLLYPGKLVASFAALYRAFWVEGRGPIGEAEVFGPVLRGVLGLSLIHI